MVTEFLIQLPADTSTEWLTERLTAALDSVVNSVVESMVTECELCRMRVGLNGTVAVLF